VVADKCLAKKYKKRDYAKAKGFISVPVAGEYKENDKRDGPDHRV
jgi:hypothetical protein